jgi:hypothetical protein
MTGLGDQTFYSRGLGCWGVVLEFEAVLMMKRNEMVREMGSPFLPRGLCDLDGCAGPASPFKESLTCITRG